MAGSSRNLDIFIPGHFPGMNEFITENRRNPYSGNRMKRKNQDIIKQNLEVWKWKNKVRKLEPPVYISYTFHERNRRRDLDNISGFFHKVFQDALVDSGLLNDDGWKDIAGFRDNFIVADPCGVHVIKKKKKK